MNKLTMMIMMLATSALADPQNPMADLPWQNHPYWYNYAWQGFLTTTATAIDKPIGAGSLFETINWYEPRNNPNAGSAIEQLPNYGALVWWDFGGGHHVMDSTGAWHLNDDLPLRLSYVEVISGYPGTNVESWFKIAWGDTLSGLAQLQPDPTIGGWVTQINLYTRVVKEGSVPEAGNALTLLVVAVLGLALGRISWGPK